MPSSSFLYFSYSVAPLHATRLPKTFDPNCTVLPIQFTTPHPVLLQSPSSLRPQDWVRRVGEGGGAAEVHEHLDSGSRRANVHLCINLGMQGCQNLHVRRVSVKFITVTLRTCLSAVQSNQCSFFFFSLNYGGEESGMSNNAGARREGILSYYLSLIHSLYLALNYAKSYEEHHPSISVNQSINQSDREKMVKTKTSVLVCYLLRGMGGGS